MPVPTSLVVRTQSEIVVRLAEHPDIGAPGEEEMEPLLVLGPASVLEVPGFVAAGGSVSVKICR